MQNRAYIQYNTEKEVNVLIINYLQRGVSSVVIDFGNAVYNQRSRCLDMPWRELPFIEEYEDRKWAEQIHPNIQIIG